MPPKGKGKKRSVGELTPIQRKEKVRKIEQERVSFDASYGASIRLQLYHDSMSRAVKKDFSQFKSRIEMQLIADHRAQAPVITGTWDSYKERSVIVRVHTRDDEAKLKTSAAKLGWAAYQKGDEFRDNKQAYNVYVKQLTNVAVLDDKTTTIQRIAEVLKKMIPNLDENQLILERPPVKGNGLHFLLFSTPCIVTRATINDMIQRNGSVVTFNGTYSFEIAVRPDPPEILNISAQAEKAMDLDVTESDIDRELEKELEKQKNIDHTATASASATPNVPKKKNNRKK